MNSFSELEQIWHSADEQLVPPPAGEIIRLVKKQRRGLLAYTICGILSLLATIPVMVWVFIGYHPRYPTTRISIVLILLAVVSMILAQTRSLPLLAVRVREDESNKAMLTSLHLLQRRQRWLSTVGISAYFLLLIAGMALYLAEFVRGNMVFGVTVYVLTFGWIAFAWFYLRKRSIRKGQEKLSRMVGYLEMLEKEWEE